MAVQHSGRSSSLTVRSNQPLIGVILEERGREMVRYFTDEDAVDAAATERSIQAALGLAGAWSDLDWDEAIAELDQIRHQSQPTPPITEL